VRTRERTWTRIVLGLTAALGGCVGYDQAVCDDPNPHACDPHGATSTQQLSDFRTSNTASRPALNSAVDVRNVVVVAVDNYLESATGHTGDIWVAERVIDASFMGCVPDPMSGGRVCGMQVFSPAYVPAGSRVIVGDLVNVSGGQYQEFDCTPCCQPPRAPCTFMGRTLPELAQPSVERVGSSAPLQPVQVSLADVLNGGDAYTGVLVQLTDDVMTGAPNTRGEFPIGPNVTITPELTPLNDPSSPDSMPQPLAQGTTLHHLTGIVSYFYSPKIMPRSINDLRGTP
jgi:hypothetical protein